MIHVAASPRQTRRAGLACSAKTKKEYQISASAFLNWLVKIERLLVNPLAKLDNVDVRGKQVRTARAFTEEEPRRLFSISGKRRLAYQILLYTGQRKSEVRARLTFKRRNIFTPSVDLPLSLRAGRPAKSAEEKRKTNAGRQRRFRAARRDELAALRKTARRRVK
jgi:hypothetical protein